MDKKQENVQQQDDQEPLEELEIEGSRKNKAGQEPATDNSMHFSHLETALGEYIQLYTQFMAKKTKSDPVVLLKQRFLDHMDTYPFLDPFSSNFDYVDNQVIIGDNVPRSELAQAIVICAGEVIDAHRLTKKFRSAIQKWSYREALEERGVTVLP